MEQVVEVYLDFEQAFGVARVPDRGFVIDHAARPAPLVGREFAGPVLIPSPDTTGYLRRDLLSDTGLFFQFAEIDPCPDGVLGFAGQWGFLHAPGLVAVISPLYSWPAGEQPARWRHLGEVVNPLGDGRSYAVVYGEPLALWEEEITAMRSLVGLWQALLKQDRDALSEIVAWEGEAISYHLAHDSGELISARERPGLWARFVPGDPILPARYLLQVQLNAKLEKYRTLPRLLLNEKNVLAPALVPDSLAAALWWQFYQAVSGERVFKRCRVCGKWQDVTNFPPGRRQQWTRHGPCANLERVRRYRAKKRREQNA